MYDDTNSGELGADDAPVYSTRSEADSVYDGIGHDPDRTVKSIPVPEAPSWNKSREATVANSRGTANTAEATIRSPDTPYFSRTYPTTPPPPPLIQETAARARARRRRGRARGADWAWLIIAGTMVGVVGLVSIILVVVLGAGDSAQAITPTATSVADRSRPTPVDLRSTNPDVVASGQRITLDNGEDIILEPWNGSGRLTILVMGVDRRPGDKGWGYLTDTIMLVSLDPITNEVGILSIPRDLYVPIRGYAEPQRINTPMLIGENREAGYGPTLAMETVQWNLGIRVHEYLIIDFNAFIGLVDAINGITVTTDYTINDPRYPSMNFGYDPFYLPSGTHDLNGYDALRFARTRHGDSDIHRATRQQQVLFAIRNKILDANLLPRLIFQAPTLYANFIDNVNTSLDIDEMIELAWYMKDIPMDNITTGVIDFTMLQSYTTGNGAQVLIPIRSRIGQLMVNVFGPDYSE